MTDEFEKRVAVLAKFALTQIADLFRHIFAASEQPFVALIDVLGPSASSLPNGFGAEDFDINESLLKRWSRFFQLRSRSFQAFLGTSIVLTPALKPFV